MEWRSLLENLASQLERLDGAGIRFLSIAPDPQLEGLLKEALPAERIPPVDPPQKASDDPMRTGKPGPARVQTETSTAKGAPPPIKSPPPEAIQHPSQLDTLESLRFHFRDCQKCPLAAGRTRVVFGVGSDKPKIVFVGEGPGQEEDRQGLPFVGRAGVLLTQGILGLGLAREDVYIANVIKCRPPGNRNPEPGEIAACAPILQRQLELLNPAVIVTLGNVPLKAFNPQARGITKARGEVIAYRNWPVLPTFHPAYLLRNSGGMAAWWADLKRARQMAYPESALGPKE